MHCSDLAYDKFWWRAVVKTVMKLPIYKNVAFHPRKKFPLLNRTPGESQNRSARYGEKTTSVSAGNIIPWVEVTA
jgi:hypothetical protein